MGAVDAISFLARDPNPNTVCFWSGAISSQHFSKSAIHIRFSDCTDCVACFTTRRCEDTAAPKRAEVVTPNGKEDASTNEAKEDSVGDGTRPPF